MAFEKPVENSRHVPKQEVGHSTIKSNNFNSNFETIREEEPMAGNHQSPTMRGPGLNRDLDVPELAGPEAPEDKNESMAFEEEEDDDQDQMEDERPEDSV